MVNTGRPSKGCLTCRRRRVKCDETRPTCNRCTKLKADCAWQDEWSSMIRHQENWAQKKVIQRVERVLHLRNERSRQPTAAIQQFPNMVTLARQPQIRPEIYAVERFYSDYAFSTATCPFLYPVEPLYHSAQTPNCLHSVIPAVALASAAKRMHRHDLMHEANQHYGRTLRRLQAVLTDTESAKQDATLLTIFLLGLYELITFDRQPGVRSPWEAHATGRLAILRLRGVDQLKTQSGRNLFVILYQEQLIASFLGENNVLDECTSWMREIFPPSLIVSMMLLMHDVSLFLRGLKKLFGQGKPGSNQLLQLLKRGVMWDEMIADLHNAFQTGRTDSSATMRYYKNNRHTTTSDATSEPLQPTPTSVSVPETDKSDLKRAKGKSKSKKAGSDDENLEDRARKDVMEEKMGEYSQIPAHESRSKDPPEEPPEEPPSIPPGPEDEVKKYLSVTRAVATNTLRAIHIHLIETLMASLSYLDPSTPSPVVGTNIDTLRTQWASKIERFSTMICDDVSYALGTCDYMGRPVEPVGGMAFRAYLSLWPMRTALSASQASLKSKRRLGKRLQHIGQEVGIGMAMQMLSSHHDLRGQDLSGEDQDYESGSRPALPQEDGALNDHVSWALSQH